MLLLALQFLVHTFLFYFFFILGHLRNELI